MSIKILDTFEPAGQYSLAHAKDIEFDEKFSVKTKIENLESIFNAEPELSYVNESDSKQYFPKGSVPVLEFRFKSPAPGKGTITITKNGSPYKTFKHNAGAVSVPLEPVNTQGMFIYKVSAVDALNRITDDLVFTFVYGGVTLSSAFNSVLQNTVYSADDENCTLEIPYSLYYAETGDGFERELTARIYKADNETDLIVEKIDHCGTENITNQTMSINHKFAQSGKYVLKLFGGIKTTDEFLSSEILTFNFTVLAPNSIAADIVTFTSNKADIDTATTCSLSYRLITNIAKYTENNALRAKLNIFKLDADGNKADKFGPDLIAKDFTSGEQRTWNLPRITTSGNYRIEIHGEPADGVMTSEITDECAFYDVFVAESAATGSTYVTDNLLAYFDAETMSNDIAQPDKWYAKNNSDYYIQLNGLNYSTNGWMTADDDKLPCLSFTGSSYGIMQYKKTPYAPMSAVGSSEDVTGHALEIVFKSKCIGELGADVLTCRNDTSSSTGGYTLRYDEAKITSVSGDVTSRAMTEDEWTHVTFVLDRQKRTFAQETNPITNATLDDLNPAPTMRIYINGCLSSCQVISNWSFFNSDVPEAFAMPLLLNAKYDNNKNPTCFGACDIKLIRIYNSALTSSQILGNYINSMRIPEKQTLTQLKNNSDSAEVPVIYFVKNKNAYIDPKKELSKVSTFKDLHAITKKKSDDKNEATSKNSWVNCTMWYKYRDDAGQWLTKTYHDVDVYLQGTSSLTYPIKNYQIKMYDTNTSTINEKGQKIHGNKLRFVPPNVGATEGWFEESADYVYTLKCDYMEQSHKNNTCTAIFYEKLIDALQSPDFDLLKNESLDDKLSVARQQTITYSITDAETGNVEEKTVSKFRDAINGFPIIVFYNDNEGAGDCNDQTDENNYVVTNDVYAGTYMFNVDKEGRQLGFNIETEEKKPLTYIDENNKVIEALDKDGNPILCNQLPCVSLEGSSNSSFAAAGAFYTLDEYNKALENNNGQENTETFKNDYDYIEATLEPRFSFADDFEDVLEESYGKELAEKIIRQNTFEKIKNTIKWVSDTVNYNDTENPLPEGSEELENLRREKFRAEFQEHFSLTYCLAYFLQMQVFAQVDNAGKNAMFDTWGGKWYPRPYDMDTQMGLNNSGVDEILPSVEINSSMSNTSITGSYAAEAEIRVGRETIDGISYDMNNHTRFTQFNTKTSQLWNSFAKYFSEEIQLTYKFLRNKEIYNVDNICNLVESLTSNVIGEKFYNMDASAKYLNTMGLNADGSIDTKYLYACQGNRDSRYRQFLKQRLIFLDTKFNYQYEFQPNISDELNLKKMSECLNTTSAFRSDVCTGSGNQYAYLGISVYSPQYVTISLGTDCTITSYVDENSKYEYNGTVYNGVLFKLPFKADNKDWTISGSANIRELSHMQGLHLTLCKIGQARKLTNLQITNSTRLQELSVAGNTYLRKIDLSGDVSVNHSLDLTGCVNIQDINIANSAITGILLPEGAPISSLNVSNTKIGNLTLSGLQFLTTENLNISNCSKITNIVLKNVPLLSEFDISSLPSLQGLTISSCSGLVNLNLAYSKLNTLSIQLCDNLSLINLTGCSGNILKDLNFSTAYGLTQLNLRNAQCTEGIHVQLPKFKSAESDERWDKLTTLIAASSSLAEIYYEGLPQHYSISTVDLTPLKNLNDCSFHSNNYLIKVEGFKYTPKSGILSEKLDDRRYGLFQGCTKLTSISGSISNFTDAQNAFYACNELSTLEQLNFINSQATNVNHICINCINLNSNSIKKVIKENPEVSSARYAFSGCKALTSLTDQSGNVVWKNLKDGSFMFNNTGITTIPADYFDKCKESLELLDYTFASCTNLETVGWGLLKNLSKLKSVRGTFANCTKLKNFFNYIGNMPTDYAGFDVLPENCDNLTETSFMLYGCYNLIMPNNTKSDGTKSTVADFFKRLTKLLRAEFTFSGITTLTDEFLGEALFENNKELISISGLFNHCTKLKGLPTYLGSTNINSNLAIKYASGVFANCTGITGKVSDSFFTGMPNIEQLGICHTKAIYGDLGNPMWSLGIFTNTKLTGISINLLTKLKNLKNVSTMFAQGNFNKTDINTIVSKTCPKFNPSNTRHDNLEYCYNSDDNQLSRGKLVIDLFKENKYLQHIDGCFAGNQGFTGFCTKDGIPCNGTDFLDSCKGNLKSMDGLFACCSYKVSENPTSYVGINTDMHVGLFKGLKELTSANYVFANCYSLPGVIPETLFKGCTKLAYTRGMFSNCESLGLTSDSDAISIPNRLFDSCRSTIVDTSFMFAYCGFAGRIGTGSAPINNNYTNKGLLAECLKLTSTRAMFAGCHNLKGAIPEDIFYTLDNQSLYSKLSDISRMFNNCWGLGVTYEGINIEGGNNSLIYGAEQRDPNTSEIIKYLIPTNWLSKCPIISNIEYLFTNIAAKYTTSFIPLIKESICTATTKKITLVKEIFFNQTLIADASFAFAGIRTLIGNLDRTFLETSLKNLVTVTGIFAECSGLTSIGDTQTTAIFQAPVLSDGVTLGTNTILKNMAGAFYNCYNLTGYGPDMTSINEINSNSMMYCSDYSNFKLINKNKYTAAQKQADQSVYGAHSLNKITQLSDKHILFAPITYNSI